MQFATPSVTMQAKQLAQSKLSSQAVRAAQHLILAHLWHGLSLLSPGHKAPASACPLVLLVEVLLVDVPPLPPPPPPLVDELVVDPADVLPPPLEEGSSPPEKSSPQESTRHTTLARASHHNRCMSSVYATGG